MQNKKEKTEKNDMGIRTTFWVRMIAFVLAFLMVLSVAYYAIVSIF